MKKNIHGQVVALLCCILTVIATPSASQTLTLEQANIRLLEVSDAVHAARLLNASAADTAAALEGLNWPNVSVDVQRLKYQKTVTLPNMPDLSDVTIGGIPLPPEVTGAISSLGGRDIVFRRTLTRPVVTAMWPLYTGGQIHSVQEGAQAMQRQAEAIALNTRHTEQVKLISLYFGQSLAEQVHAVRCQQRDAMQWHYNDVRAMEREGVATRAQRLQIEAARDAAERGCVEAGYTLESARIALADLLRTENIVHIATPLFIFSETLDTAQAFIGKAQAANGTIRSMAAASDAASQKVNAELARWKPNVFLFGSYNMRRRDELLTEPDWIVGVGLKYDLIAETDRRRSVSAARNAFEASRRTLDETRNQVRTGVASIYMKLENARQQYLLLESTEALARENARIQSIAFREGQNTIADIIDAETMLTAALVERAAAAYTYDVMLAQLLDATGELDRYFQLMKNADRTIAGNTL